MSCLGLIWSFETPAHREQGCGSEGAVLGTVIGDFSKEDSFKGKSCI